MINSYEAKEDESTRRRQRNANIAVVFENGTQRARVCELMEEEEKRAKAESEEVADLRALSANSTRESFRSVSAEANESLSNARKTPFLEIQPTRPNALFTAGAKPSFNILEQLKLDEIRDAQEQLLLNSGQQLKALRKKKKKKRKKNKKQKPIGEQATIFWTQLTTKKPHYIYHTTTTKVPKKIKYIVRKKNTLKKKKKEYLNHLKHVLYPFIKFIAFFTVLNPFTLKVFIFALISPVIFGFLGFMALSFMVKPALHLIFDVKKRVDIIKRKQWREKKRRERWRYGRRPITIHKHYYKNVVAPHPPKPKPKPKPPIHISHEPPIHTISHEPPIHISHEPPHLSHPPLNWPEWVRADQIDFRLKLQSQRPSDV
ncbi:PREDICTED: uncharacterized protein LOC108381016, partial [Rhagoletis zephyria]|uniref:uncharacterized protein LOC108381016 n=1 Tax=Rhagoletis zephyria TaxID=28612 RepID=UPI0008114D1A